MSAEGILDDPALFSQTRTKEAVGEEGEVEERVRKLMLAMEYLTLVQLHPVPLKSVIFHVRRICRDAFNAYQLLEDCLAAGGVDEVIKVVQQVGELCVWESELCERFVCTYCSCCYFIPITVTLNSALLLLTDTQGLVYAKAPPSSPSSFVFDPYKEKRRKELLALKKREEGKRKAYEQRMMRKSKREGKDINFYLNIGECFCCFYC